MAVKTYTQQLEQVQAAIDAIETGAQSYTIQTGIGTSREVSRANINWLYQREKFLREQIAREDRGGARVRYGTPC